MAADFAKKTGAVVEIEIWNPTIRETANSPPQIVIYFIFFALLFQKFGKVFRRLLFEKFDKGLHFFIAPLTPFRTIRYDLS
jgi:hypothetical protein